MQVSLSSHKEHSVVTARPGIIHMAKTFLVIIASGVHSGAIQNFNRYEGMCSAGALIRTNETLDEVTVLGLAENGTTLWELGCKEENNDEGYCTQDAGLEYDQFTYRFMMAGLSYEYRVIEELSEIKCRYYRKTGNDEEVTVSRVDVREARGTGTWRVEENAPSVLLGDEDMLNLKCPEEFDIDKGMAPAIGTLKRNMSLSLKVLKDNIQIASCRVSLTGGPFSDYTKIDCSSEGGFFHVKVMNRGSWTRMTGSEFSAKITGPSGHLSGKYVCSARILPGGTYTHCELPFGNGTFTRECEGILKETKTNVMSATGIIEISGPRLRALYDEPRGENLSGADFLINATVPFYCEVYSRKMKYGKLYKFSPSRKDDETLRIKCCVMSKVRSTELCLSSKALNFSDLRCDSPVMGNLQKPWLGTPSIQNFTIRCIEKGLNVAGYEDFSAVVDWNMKLLMWELVLCMLGLGAALAYIALAKSMYIYRVNYEVNTTSSRI